MTDPKVGIATYAEIKARTLAIAKGELQPKPGDPKIWATSPASYARLMLSQSRSILEAQGLIF